MKCTLGTMTLSLPSALHFQRLGTQRMSIVIKQLLLKTLLSKATYNTYIYSNSLKKVHLKSR